MANITERIVAKLYRRYQQCTIPKEQLQIFKQFQHAENVIFGRHLTQVELNAKVQEWEKKGFIE